MPGQIVFISYSHDSAEHREKVLGLAERLRQDGLDARLDQYVKGTPEQGWPRWMLDRLDEASFVLVVCTETYYRRFRGHEVRGRGKGASWEGALITQEIYDATGRTVKFVPVLLSAGQESFIPEPLSGHTYYELISEDRYHALYEFLVDQPSVEPGPLGSIKLISKRVIPPLRFDLAPGSSSPAERSTARRVAPDTYSVPAPSEALREQELDREAAMDVAEAEAPMTRTTKRRMLFIALAGWVAAWFLPAFEPDRTQPKWRGAEAFLMAVATNIAFLKGGAEGSQAEEPLSIENVFVIVVLLLSPWSNFLFLAGVLVLYRGRPGWLCRRLAALLLVSFGVNLLWVWLVNIEALRIGYYLWVASFLLLGSSLFPPLEPPKKTAGQ